MSNGNALRLSLPKSAGHAEIKCPADPEEGGEQCLNLSPQWPGPELVIHAAPEAW